MLQYSHRGPPITGAASEVSPLKLRLGPPCEGCPERNQQGAQQKAPLQQLGPLAINRSTALGMGDKLSSLQAPHQGHHQRSAKKKQSPIFHFAVGLACAAWAVWGCLGCLGLQQQAGTTALGEGGHQGNAGSGAAQGDLEVHGSHRCWGMAPDLFKFGPIRMQASQLDHGRV